MPNTNVLPTHSRSRTPRRRTGAGHVRAFVVIGLGLVLWMWWAGTDPLTGRTPGGSVTAAGELSGMIASFLICIQILLIARIPWFERAVGMDRLVAWHRTLGTSVLLLIATHVSFMVLGGSLTDSRAPWTEVTAILASYPDMITALIGTGVFLVVGMTTARAARQRLSYEAWYWLHVSIYGAVFLTFAHQISAGTHFLNSPFNRLVWIALYLATAAAVLTWRVVLPAVRAVRHRFRVVEVVTESSGIASVWLQGRHLEELDVQAGQFFLFRFLSRGHFWTAHPYSVSGLPREGLMRITVGALGDHSAGVARLRPGTPVIVEGPFGHFTAARARSRRVVLIAGGAGIGPIRALAQELVDTGHRVEVIYRSSTAAQLALTHELVVLPGLTLHSVVGRRAELGYDPLRAQSLRRLVPNIGKREVFVCGPPGMTQAVYQSLRSLGVPRNNIHREELSLQ